MTHEPSVIALPLLEDCHSARIADLGCASLSDAAEYGASNHGWQTVSLPLSLLTGKPRLMQLDLMEPDAATKLAAVSLEALLKAQGDPMSDLTVRRVVTANYVFAIASLADGTHVYEAVELVANRNAEDPAMVTIQCYDEADDDEGWGDEVEWDEEEDEDEDSEDEDSEDEDEEYESDEDEYEDEEEEADDEDDADADFEVEDEELDVDGADEVDVEDPEEEAVDPEPDGDGAGRAA